MRCHALLLSLVVQAGICVSGLCPAQAAAPTQVWVNSRWTRQDCAQHTWQEDAFDHIQAAVTKVAPGGRVFVAPGVYPEKLVLAKPVTLVGPCAGVNPNLPVKDDPFAANPARNDMAGEAVIVPPAIDLNVPSGLLVEILADDVTLDGFTLDGHNPALTGGVSLNGIEAQMASGVGEEGGHPQRFAILNNRIQNFLSHGIYLKNPGFSERKPQEESVSIGGEILQNRLDNLSAVGGTMPEWQKAPTGIGIYLYNEVYAEILGNTTVRTAVGVWMANYFDHRYVHLYCVDIIGNAYQTYVTGIGLNNIAGASDGVVGAHIARNTISIIDWAKPATLQRYAVYLLSIFGGEMVVNDNTISGGEIGVLVWNIEETPTHLLLSGGTIRDCQYGIVANNNSPIYGKAGGLTRLVVDRVTVRNAATAALTLDDDPTGDGPIDVTVTNGTTLVGGGAGVVVRGSRAHLTLLGPSPLALEGQAAPYVSLQYNGATAPSELDLRDVLIAGKHRAEMTEAEVAAVRAKLQDQQADARVGLLKY